MVDVTIDDLLDGEALRTASSVAAFNQAGLTFKGTISSNPPRMFPAINQAQLEAELGVNLEIPDGEKITISINDDFTIDKPFKVGLNSILEIESPVIGTRLTCDQIGAICQNTNPLNPITSLFLRNITLVGNGTNSVFDIFGINIVRAENVSFENFDSMGISNTTFDLFDKCAFTNLNKGMVFKNPLGVGLIQNTIFQPTAKDITSFSILAGANIPALESNLNRVLSFFAGDALLFLDPNSLDGSRFSVEKTDAPGGDIYRQGADIDILSVTSAGAGNAQFTTTSAHGLNVGDLVVVKDFVANLTYNGTFVVIAVDTPITGDEFRITPVFTGSESVGKMTKASLDSTDVRVLADKNQDSPDSMFTGDAGLEIFGSEVSSSSLAQDAFEVITSASWAYNNLERFAIGVSNQGQLIVQDPKLRKYAINYGGTIEKSGGGSLNVGVVLLKNGSIIGFNPPHTVNSGKIQITRGDIVELTKDDTIQVAVINYDASATAIDISQVSLVINRA